MAGGVGRHGITAVFILFAYIKAAEGTDFEVTSAVLGFAWRKDQGTVFYNERSPSCHAPHH